MSGIIENPEIHRTSGSPERLQLLLKPDLIVLNKAKRGLHDFLCRPVIRSQKHPFCPRKILFKAEHDLRLRPAEPVDRLVIISDDKEIVLRQCQHPDNLILKKVNILELIHENILKLLLPCCQDVLPLRKQLMAHDEHIVEVDLSRRFQHLIVPVIKLFKPLFRAVLGIVVLQIQALAFYVADLIDDGGDKFRLVLDLHL